MQRLRSWSAALPSRSASMGGCSVHGADTTRTLPPLPPPPPGLGVHWCRHGPAACLRCAAWHGCLTWHLGPCCSKSAAECRGWAERGLCWQVRLAAGSRGAVQCPGKAGAQRRSLRALPSPCPAVLQDPRFMHYYCRETCGLCRLPAGRPQPTFSWDGKPVPGGSGGGGAASSGGTAQPAAGGLRSSRHRDAGRAFARYEWHAMHAGGGEAAGASEGGAGAHRAVLLIGAGGWGFLLFATLSAAVHGLWRRRHGRHGGAAQPRRGRRPGSGDGGTSTPTLPLLR